MFDSTAKFWVKVSRNKVCKDKLSCTYLYLSETELDRKKSLNAELEQKATLIEQDFEQYKVRAQSVLRQVKEKDSAIGAKAQELASLERVVQNLNEKIADLR